MQILIWITTFLKKYHLYFFQIKLIIDIIITIIKGGLGIDGRTIPEWTLKK